jgi:hypothetical protein
MTKKLLVALTALSVAGLAQADLLTNPGLEGGTGLADVPSWTSWGGSGTLEGGYYQEGSQSVRFWFNDTGFYQDFAATIGEAYDFWGYLYTPSGGDQYTWDGENLTYATVKVEWHRSDDSLISSTDATHFTPDNSPDTWTQVTGSDTAPAETDYGRIVFAIEGAGPGSGTVAFDNVDVSQQAIPEPTTFALVAGAFGLLYLRRKLS